MDRRRTELTLGSQRILKYVGFRQRNRFSYLFVLILALLFIFEMRTFHVEKQVISTGSGNGYHLVSRHLL